jgi:hypothetical protein
VESPPSEDDPCLAVLVTVVGPEDVRSGRGALRAYHAWSTLVTLYPDRGAPCSASIFYMGLPAGNLMAASLAAYPCFSRDMKQWRSCSFIRRFVVCWVKIAFCTACPDLSVRRRISGTLV